MGVGVSAGAAARGTLPSRVLMTTDCVGGVWTYSLDLASGLLDRGIDVVLAAMGPAPSAEQRREAQRLGVRLEHAPFPLEWMADPWRELEVAGDWLLHLERRNDCDLVHLNGYALAARAFKSRKIIVAHSCVLSWWEGVHGETAPPEWDRYKSAVRYGLASAAAVLSPTRWMRGAIERHYGADGRSGVIYNARRPGLFQPAQKQPFILGAGRVWDAAKNLSTLARAGHSLPWPVKIAGPLGSPSEKLEDGVLGASPFGTSAGVELLGVVATEAMAELYAQAAVYAHPARYEPFGLTALEAALSGCALVLGDIPSLRELWDDAAVFVPPADVEALAASLRDLALHPERRQELAAAAWRRAATFGYDQMIDAYVRVYADVSVNTQPTANTDAPVMAGAAREERGCAS